jgi:hypothetical protein
MPCTTALPEFIISGNGVMINLIAADLPCCTDEASERLCRIAGKRTGKIGHVNSNVRKNTSNTRKITGHRTSQYHRWVSPHASPHRCIHKTLKYLFYIRLQKGSETQTS